MGTRVLLAISLTLVNLAHAIGDPERSSRSKATNTPVLIAPEHTYCDSNVKFVTLSDQYGDQMIELYDLDGATPWHEFTFAYDDSDGIFEYENEAFKPFSFHPDYYDFALEIVETTDDYYVVVANHNSNILKVIYKAAFFTTVTLPELYEDTEWFDTNKSLPALDVVAGTALTAYPGTYVIIAIEGRQIRARIEDDEFIGPLNDLLLPICFEGEIILFSLR